MGWVESLQKAINYIEDHLLEPVTIEDIASQANASVYHFQRTFALLTDTTVGEYLRRRRLSLAAQELVDHDVKVIDLALKYGYETPEAFTKAFRRQHGVTPSQIRRTNVKLNSYNRLVIQVSLKGVEPMRYKIVERDCFQVVGMKKEFSLKNEEFLSDVPKMWNEFNDAGKEDWLLNFNNGELKAILGVCVDKKNSDDKTMDYWIATEHVGDTSDEILSMEIPDSKWGVFEVHGAMPDAMQNTWRQIFSEWFPSHSYEHAGKPELEVYYEGEPYKEDYYSEIWIPLK